MTIGHDSQFYSGGGSYMTLINAFGDDDLNGFVLLMDTWQW